MIAPAKGWRAWFGTGTLEASQQDALRAEAHATNLSRFRWVMPLMVLVHVVHIWLFWLSGAERLQADATYVLWRDGVVGIHGITAVVVLALWGLVLAPVGRRWRWLGPATGLIYLLHGAAIAGVDQLNAPNVSPYMAYSLAIAFMVALEPPVILAIWSAGLVAFFAAVISMQPLPEVQLTLLPNGPSVTVASIALGLLLYAGRLRDFRQRATIDEQRLALESLNADLSQQVVGQVTEIVARVEEVERLNAQLQQQVRDRSNALAKALSRLAHHSLQDSELQEGTVLADRFHVGELIGKGGMGAVYCGIDRVTGDAVAIKIIQASSMAPMTLLHRFLREARAASSVTHPAIVKVIAVDIADDGTFYQVQELVDGQTLAAVLDDKHHLEADVAVRHLGVLASALAAAHAQGVVHRDVKPSNLMITAASPGLKVLDFGISKVQADEVVDGQTDVGVVLGTPAYMAPEQMSGSHNTTDRADLYALGIVAFLMLTGEHPIFGKQTLLPLGAPLTDRLPQLPSEVAMKVLRCLSADPETRPSAQEMAEAFGA